MLTENSSGIFVYILGSGCFFPTTYSISVFCIFQSYSPFLRYFIPSLFNSIYLYFLFQSFSVCGIFNHCPPPTLSNLSIYHSLFSERPLPGFHPHPSGGPLSSNPLSPPHVSLVPKPLLSLLVNPSQRIHY